MLKMKLLLVAGLVALINGTTGLAWAQAVPSGAVAVTSPDAEKSQIVVYRVKGDASYMPTIFVNGHVVGSLMPNSSTSTSVCKGDFDIRVDTRNKASLTGLSQTKTANQPVVYFQVSDLSNGLFNVQQVSGEYAQAQMGQLKIVSHVINRNVVKCQAPEVKQEVVQTLRSVSLGADALFDFGKSTLLPAGYTQLDKLLSDVNAQKINASQIIIVGYTDALGSEETNQKLSQARAEAVKQFFTSRGITASITAVGQGENSPVSSGCERIKKRAAKIDCYRVDRRVTIEILGHNAV